MRIVTNREDGGRLVRSLWIEWAMTQPCPKESWLVPWDELEESDKEVDRQIWEGIATPYIQELRQMQERLECSLGYICGTCQTHITYEEANFVPRGGEEDILCDDCLTKGDEA